MKSQNRYCCRCHRTTRFLEQGAKLTCSDCGLVVEVTAREPGERALIGNPMRSFRTRSGS